MYFCRKTLADGSCDCSVHDSFDIKSGPSMAHGLCMCFDFNEKQMLQSDIMTLLSLPGQKTITIRPINALQQFFYTMDYAINL